MTPIDFAVTAPVLVPEKRQAGADVAHTPEDTTTMLGKRGGAEDAELYNLFLQKLNKHSLLNGNLAEPKALAAKPGPNPRPSNQGLSNQGLLNPGSSNPASLLPRTVIGVVEHRIVEPGTIEMRIIE